MVGVCYLKPEDFFAKYPKTDEQVGSGTSAKVFACKSVKGSKTPMVIKECFDLEEYSFARELHAHSALKHACILAPEAFTIHEHKGYFAMERGMSIREAFSNKYITIRQIISDLMAALTFLNSNGYVHGDLKPGNMLYVHKPENVFNGKCMLIDFGFCFQGVKTSASEWHMNFEAYTENYRDVEYSNTQPNNIKCEIFALLASVQSIMEASEVCYGSVYAYSSFSDQTLAKHFFAPGCKPWAERESMQEMMNRLKHIPREEGGPIIVREYPNGEVIPQEALPFSRGRCASRRLMQIMAWMTLEACSLDLSSRTLLCALHFMVWTFPKLKQDCKPGVAERYARYYACVCLNIALLQSNEDICFPIEFWLKRIGHDDKEKIPSFRQFYIDFLTYLCVLTNGQTSPTTAWHYAQSEAEQRAAVFDFIFQTYIPGLQAVTEEKQPRWLGAKTLARTLFSENDIALLQTTQKPNTVVYEDENHTYYLREIIATEPEASSAPLWTLPHFNHESVSRTQYSVHHLESDASVLRICNVWKNDLFVETDNVSGGSNFVEHVAVVFHNRDAVLKLPFDRACKIAENLLYIRENLLHFRCLMDHVLTALCQGSSEWDEWEIDDFFAKKQNPFVFVSKSKNLQRVHVHTPMDM